MHDKQKYNRQPNACNKQSLWSNSIFYKRTIHHQVRDFKHKHGQKLGQLHSINAKQYWRV